MKHYLIAQRYAKALSAAISDPAQLEPVLVAMKRLSELYSTEHDFRSVLDDPAIDAGRRAAVLAEVLQIEGLPPQVSSLADVLLRRGRIALVADVAAVFATIVDERLNRVTALVTTAGPLTRDQEPRLREALSAFSKRTVSMECSVDPEILGGVMAQIGGTVVDGSLRTRLERMKEALVAEETPQHEDPGD